MPSLPDGTIVVVEGPPGEPCDPFVWGPLLTAAKIEVDTIFHGSMPGDPVLCLGRKRLTRGDAVAALSALLSAFEPTGNIAQRVAVQRRQLSALEQRLRSLEASPELAAGRILLKFFGSPWQALKQAARKRTALTRRRASLVSPLEGARAQSELPPTFRLDVGAPDKPLLAGIFARRSREILETGSCLLRLSPASYSALIAGFTADAFVVDTLAFREAGPWQHAGRAFDIRLDSAIEELHEWAKGAGIPAMIIPAPADALSGFDDELARRFDGVVSLDGDGMKPPLLALAAAARRAGHEVFARRAWGVGIVEVDQTDGDALADLFEAANIPVSERVPLVHWTTWEPAASLYVWRATSCAGCPESVSDLVVRWHHERYDVHVSSDGLVGLSKEAMTRLWRLVSESVPTDALLVEAARLGFKRCTS